MFCWNQNMQKLIQISRTNYGLIRYNSNHQQHWILIPSTRDQLPLNLFMAMLAKHIETKGRKKKFRADTHMHLLKQIWSTWYIQDFCCWTSKSRSKMNSLRTNRGSEISSSKKKFYKNYVMHNEIALYIPKQNRVTNN